MPGQKGGKAIFRLRAWPTETEITWKPPSETKELSGSVSLPHLPCTNSHLWEPVLWCQYWLPNLLAPSLLNPKLQQIHFLSHTTINPITLGPLPQKASATYLPICALWGASVPLTGHVSFHKQITRHVKTCPPPWLFWEPNTARNRQRQPLQITRLKEKEDKTQQQSICNTHRRHSLKCQALGKWDTALQDTQVLFFIELLSLRAGEIADVPNIETDTRSSTKGN